MNKIKFLLTYLQMAYDFKINYQKIKNNHIWFEWFPTEPLRINRCCQWYKFEQLPITNYYSALSIFLFYFNYESLVAMSTKNYSFPKSSSLRIQMTHQEKFPSSFSSTFLKLCKNLQQKIRPLVKTYIKPFVATLF